MTLAQTLVALGAAIFVALGALHGVVTLRDVSKPIALTPTDPRVREAMQGARLALNPRANLWQAWLGFNLTALQRHSPDLLPRRNGGDREPTMSGLAARGT